MTGDAPAIATTRLHLRRPIAADVAAVFARYASCAETTRYLGWPRHRSEADTRAFVAWSDAEWQRWPSGPLLAFAIDDGRLVGATGLAFETPLRASTGFVVAPDCRRAGFATEMLRAMVVLARDLGVVRLHAFCHVGHTASARVLARGGLRHEGVLRGYLKFPNLPDAEPQDVVVHAILPQQDPVA